MKPFKKNNKGFSLVEVMVAIAVLVLVATSVLNGFVQASRINAKAQYLQDATNLAQMTAERFQSESLDDLITRFEALGIAITDSSTTATADELARGERVVTFSGITEDYIYNISNGGPFTVDITLDSSQYVSNTAFTSTYDQEALLAQTVNGMSNVVANSFVVPVMKETKNQLIISAGDYSDAAAISAYKSNVQSEYVAAMHAAHPFAAGTAGYTSVESTAAAYIESYMSTYFPDGASNIMASAYDLSDITRALTIKVDCSGTGTGSNVISVTAKAKYTFPAVSIPDAMGGSYISISSFTTEKELISEADSKSYVFDCLDADGIKDIYFYYNVADTKHGYYNPLNQSGDHNYTGSLDSVEVWFTNSAASFPADGTCSLYLIAQDFQAQDLSGNIVNKVPLFRAGSISVNSSSSGAFACYSNFQYYQSELKPVLTNAYLTDGGSNRVNMYDMTISVKKNGEEYALLKTIKEE